MNSSVLRSSALFLGSVGNISHSLFVALVGPWVQMQPEVCFKPNFLFWGALPAIEVLFVAVVFVGTIILKDCLGKVADESYLGGCAPASAIYAVVMSIFMVINLPKMNNQLMTCSSNRFVGFERRTGALTCRPGSLVSKD